jgi:isoquinoline 1-oxidoreductase beta subunit
MLLTAAADTWKVDRATLRAENGRVLGPGGRSLAYGQLVDKARTVPVPQDVALRTRRSSRSSASPRAASIAARR